MQHLLFDVALLCDFSQIRCRIDVPLRTVRMNLPDTEMQVFPALARFTEPISGLYCIIGSHEYLAEVFVGTLYFAAVRTGVFHRERFVSDSDDLAALFRRQHCIAVVTSDVHACVHSFCPVLGVLPLTKR